MSDARLPDGPRPFNIPLDPDVPFLPADVRAAIEAVKACIGERPEAELAAALSCIVQRTHVHDSRDELIAAIRAREPRDTQLAKADRYIACIRLLARFSGRRLPLPNRSAVLRQLG